MMDRPHSFRPMALGLIFMTSGLAPVAWLGGQSLAYDLEIPAVERDRFSVPVQVEIPLVMGMRRDRDRWMGRLRSSETSDRPVQVVVEEREGEGRFGLVHWVEAHIPAGESTRYDLFMQPGPRRMIRGTPQFRFENGDGFRDLRHGEQGVMRFVTLYDPDRHDDTHKPYEHLFGFHGEGFLTKGPGGRFPHHKGIFLGWNRTMVDGNRHDFWHARRERQQHVGFDPEDEVLGPLLARAAAVTDWITAGDVAVVRDRRQVTVWHAGEGEWIFDYDILIESLAGEIRLDGDAHHAGFQIRASQEVAERSHETVYFRPDSAVDAGNDLFNNLEWMALRMPLGDRTYLLVHMSHPDNPGPTVYSGRDYGRFGAFFTATISDKQPLRLRYRIVAVDLSQNREIDSAVIASRYADYADGVEVLLRSRLMF